MTIRLVALHINCGFADTALRVLTPGTKGPNKQIDKEKWISEFKELFAQCPKYGCNEPLRAVEVMVPFWLWLL